MPDYLDLLARDAMRSVEEGCYETTVKASSPHLSLTEAILRCKRTPVISEVKFASPTMGTLRESCHLERIVKEMEEGGAVGISILTEPKHFEGRIRFIGEARDHVRVPILMKDIIISPVQIEAASSTGANAVLLIQTLFDRGYCEKDVHALIEYSHLKGLEVLLETHTEDEFHSALQTSTDMIGINNRNLSTLQVDLDVTKRILAKHWAHGRMIVSESGINGPSDIRFLRECGARAFLVGSTVMKARRIREKVRELVNA